MRRCRLIVLGIALTLAVLGFFGRELVSDQFHQRDETNAKASVDSRGTVDVGQESEPFDLVRARTKLPEGLLVEGKAYLVRSPYSPDSGYMDVEGLEPGTKILCPWTNKPFLIPDPGTYWIEWLPENVELSPNPAPGEGGEDDEKGSDVELFTHRYQVPPEWIASLTKEEPRPSAKEILERLGIRFRDEGTAAFYVSSNSELVVRNTEEQLATVGAVVSEAGGRLNN